MTFTVHIGAWVLWVLGGLVVFVAGFLLALWIARKAAEGAIGNSLW